MSAPNIIETLVETFAANLDAYKSGTFNEAQARIQFINPMLTALGWDVSNRAGYAEAYKDVIHEDSLRIGSAVKAPDYCCRIGGVRKFFVEAKKPSINIKEDVHPAYQLRRYAWSAKLPLSVLTDFEEFAVYDCRVRPVKMDKASTARVMYMRFEEYPERWHEIENIFSRESILKGSFDKYAESHKKKRGTASVDAAFLSEIETWREQLAGNIALRNSQLSQRELNHTVQQTIDRIIFLRIAEDRGIEEYGRLMALQNGKDVYGRMLEQFREADAKYNSGLFHFRKSGDSLLSSPAKPETGKSETVPVFSGFPDELSPSLVMDDKVLKPILKSLYYPDSPYEFSVLPADILGQTYEQFLGKVIRLTAGHRAVVEDKPEVKKAGGVYYTPTYIVDYIVQHTIGKLLEGKTSRQVAKLRICDPACGSGSFLLGAYQYLLDWHLKWYVENNPEKWAKGRDPKIYQVLKGEWRLTTSEKKRILLNNIYGVDIDQQAVEVTKLSLLLKVLENETQDTLGRQMSMFHERALPDLATNIKCGNSLIGPDFYDQQDLGLMDEEERYRINVFDWHAEFPDIFSGKASGFDAVIGNPPYGAVLSKEETSFLLSNFNLQDYQLDTYLLFVEKSFGLLRGNGLFGMIIPNTWLLNLQSKRIRLQLFNQTQIEFLVHYRRPVFSKATVDTEVVIIKNRRPNSSHEIDVEVVEKDGFSANHKVSQKRWQSGNGAPVNIFERSEWIALADKLHSFTKLDDVCVITQGCKPFQVGKGKPHQTRNIVDEKPFVGEVQRDSTFRPLLRGSLIKSYRILWDNDYWISFGKWLAEPRYSASYEAPEKIVIRQTGDSLIAALDRDQFIVRDNLYTIVPRQEEIALLFILGLLNSRLLTWFYQSILNPEMGEALAQVKRGHLARLPIAQLKLTETNDKARHDQMVKIVERMLALHKQLTAAKTGQDKTMIQRQITTTGSQIDRLVYELYDLTDEEIAIVKQY